MVLSIQSPRSRSRTMKKRMKAATTTRFNRVRPRALRTSSTTTEISLTQMICKSRPILKLRCRMWLRIPTSHWERSRKSRLRSKNSTNSRNSENNWKRPRRSTRNWWRVKRKTSKRRSRKKRMKKRRRRPSMTKNQRRIRLFRKRCSLWTNWKRKRGKNWRSKKNKWKPKKRSKTKRSKSRS